MSTIVETLQSQRTLLVDVVRQIDTAIATFGGTTPNGNGNGVTKNGGGSGSWWKTASPSKRARAVRRMVAGRKAARHAANDSTTTL